MTLWELFKKWVNSFENSVYAASDEGIERTRQSMLSELRSYKTRKNVSPGLISETKGELILLGKLKKARNKK